MTGAADLDGLTRQQLVDLLTIAGERLTVCQRERDYWMGRAVDAERTLDQQAQRCTERCAGP